MAYGSSGNMIPRSTQTERPHETPGYVVTHATDLAENPGLELYQLERFLDEIRYQPNWRYVADEEADYYDGNQLTIEEAADLEERGLAPIIVNLCKPTIDLVLGIEAKSRRDWIVKPDEDSEKDLADALTVKLHEAARLSRANRATADAFSHQVKIGLGWVGVMREMDPFKPPYRMESIHRREMWWDWRAKDPLLDDARYMLRKQWFDMDQVIAVFPEHRELIRHAATGWSEWDYTRAQLDQMFVRDWYHERDTSIDDMDWRDTARQRLALYEIWYKKWERGHVLRLPNGRVIEFDRKNPRHREVVAAKAVVPELRVFPKVRLSWWIGPHRIIDVPNPMPFNRFPYVPFFGYREDRTGVPFGLMRSMKAPQDEFNARRRKMMWLLSAKRVIADNDAVLNKDHDTVMQEVSRPDAYIKLNQNRINKNEGAFRVEDDFALTNQQFQVMTDAADRLQSAAGVYLEMLGKGQTGQSGVAIANLVEQGQTALGEIMDNYLMARKECGEMLLSLVRQDLAGQDNLRVPIGQKGERNRRTVFLNAIQGEHGGGVRTNDVTILRGQVALEEVPSSPTYMQNQLQSLSDIVKVLPEGVRAGVIDMVVEATDLKNKDELAARIRKLTGLDNPDPEDMNPKERAEYEAERKQKAAAAQMQQRAFEAEVRDKEASAIAKLQKAQTDARMAQAKVAEIEAKIKDLDRDHQFEYAELDLKAELEKAKQELDERIAVMNNATKVLLEQMQDETRRLETAVQDKQFREQAKARSEEVKAKEKDSGGKKAT